MEKKGTLTKGDSKKTGRESGVEVDCLSTEKDEIDDDDDVILDDEESAVNFTSDLSHMAGAPYHPEVREYIRNSSVNIPKHKNHLSDLNATKT